MKKESCKERTMPPMRIDERNLNDIEIDAEIKKRLISVGISKILLPKVKYNFIGGKSGDSSESMKFLLQELLDNVITTDKLIITDPYIFPKKVDATYSDFVVSILEKYLKKLTTITFIVKKGHINTEIKDNIYNKLKLINYNLNIDIKESDSFHDRFWISDFESKGLFVGCSLNNIKKYFLVDYFSKEDVKTIVSELKLNNLI